MKRLYLSILALILMVCGSSQTVVWKMQPKPYSEITRINNNLYQVSQNGKIGLIHADGSIVAPIENDNIGDFYAGRALVTKVDGYGERVMGCLTEDGHYTPINTPYYTLSRKKFFSDGTLTVTDNSGKLGYIDTNGNAILGFDGKWTKIYPFVDGYAAVFKGNKYYLIDKNGDAVKFKFSNPAELKSGTNPYKGSVYVWDTKGNVYTCKLSGSGLCEKTKKPKDDKTVDYLYRFACITGDPKEVPYYKHSAQGQMGLTPVSEDGLYGFADGEVIILPLQLSHAGTFEDDIAIVLKGNQRGILQYIPDQKFDIANSQTTTNFYKGDNIKCQFSVLYPHVWDFADLKVEVRDTDGKLMETSNNDGAHSFIVKPQKSGTMLFSVVIYGQDLKLYEGTLTYDFLKRERCPICGKDKSVCPGHEQPKQQEVPLCPTCGKKITECEYGGAHY